MSALRIAFLSWRDTTHPDGGGAEIFQHRIAAALASRGDHVTIVCAAHPDAPRDEVRDGVHIRRRGGRLTVYPRGLAYLLGRAGRRQDVVIDVINGLPFGARLVRRRGVIALIHHLHREQWHMIYSGAIAATGWWVESRVVPRLYRHADVITVSEATRRDLGTLGFSPERITIVRNGIDPPSPAALHAPIAPSRLCVLGRLVPHKRVEHALAAVAALSPAHPDLRLDIVGCGWWEERLRGEAARLGVTDRVVFHGRLDAADRDLVLRRSTVVLIPSVKEGWAISAIEAAAVGTPVIGYRTAGGVAESVVEGVTGLLADSLNDLIRLTGTLLDDEKRRAELSAGARRHAVEFTWERSAQAFEAALGKFSDRRTGRSGRRPG